MVLEGPVFLCLEATLHFAPPFPRGPTGDDLYNQQPRSLEEMAFRAERSGLGAPHGIVEGARRTDTVLVPTVRGHEGRATRHHTRAWSLTPPRGVMCYRLFNAQAGVRGI